ncbi:MAG: sulfotransferase domain-containing protein, partial [Alphaproteobacteria bacterium]
NTWLRFFLANYLLDSDEPLTDQQMRQISTSEPLAQWYAPRLNANTGAKDLRAIAKIRATVQSDIAASTPDSILVKTHSSVGNAFGFPQINQQVSGGALYVVRNPLDVVISFSDHYGRTIDESIEAMATDSTVSAMRPDRVFEWWAAWSTHVENWTKNESPSLLVMRFEDMLADARSEFEKVVQILNLEMDDAKFSRAIEFSSFNVLKKMEQTTGFDEKSPNSEAFFRQGTKDQWRDVLSRDQVRAIVRRHRETMKRFGYVPSGF